MLNFYKNKLFNKWLLANYGTFQLTLDTCDFVPAKYNDKILKLIFKNMKKQLGKVNREDKIYQSLNAPLRKMKLKQSKFAMRQKLKQAKAELRRVKKQARLKAKPLNKTESEKEVNDNVET